MRKLMILLVAFVGLAAGQTEARAAAQSSTMCKRVNGKIVHRAGEHCIVLRRGGALVTIRREWQ